MSHRPRVLRRPAARRGVTLIELVIVIALVAIVGATLGMFMWKTMKFYEVQPQHAALVDSAENALRRMGRDIRIAVPNSLRISTSPSGYTGFAIELIPTTDGGRYCSSGVANCTTVGASAELAVASADDNFDILGCFRNSTFTTAATSGTTAYRLVLNNAGDDVYTATTTSSVLTPSTTTLTLTTATGGGAGSGACGASSGANTSYRHHLALSATQTFPSSSPRQRIFVIEDAAAPVSYLCNQTAGTLKRYAGYKVGSAYGTSTQPTDPGAAPLNSATSVATMADSVDTVNGCSVTTSATDVKGLGFVSISLTLTKKVEGEKVGTATLLYQVQLDNSQ